MRDSPTANSQRGVLDGFMGSVIVCRFIWLFPAVYRAGYGGRGKCRRRQELRYGDMFRPNAGRGTCLRQKGEGDG